MKTRNFSGLVLSSLLVTSGAVLAGAGHDEEGQGGMQKMHDQMQDMHQSMQAEQHGGMGGHMHTEWVKPPVEYRGKQWNKWGDHEIAERGEQLYQQNCVSCHGQSGTGDGPAGVALPHKPANLTNHFHMAPGKGDDYLFWRISEGGTVEPFHSMQSAMPAFKSSLSEADRWAVLTYVHQQFHKGFKGAGHGEAAGHDEEKGHHDENKGHGHES